MCNYQGYEFGGVYLDSVCIDGYLWDEDSYDDGYLTNGGDEPCPACNCREWAFWHREEVEGLGYFACENGAKLKDCPSFRNIRCHDKKMIRKLKKWWRNGWSEARNE